MVDASVQWTSTARSAITSLGCHTRLRLFRNPTIISTVNTELQKGEYIPSEYVAKRRRRTGRPLYYICYTIVAVSVNESLRVMFCAYAKAMKLRRRPR